MEEPDRRRSADLSQRRLSRLPRYPVPELGGAEPIPLLFNHLSGASTASLLLDHSSFE